MNVQKLKNKNLNQLKLELIKLYTLQINLKLKIKNGQLRQTHLLKNIRHDIAYIKMLLSNKR